MDVFVISNIFAISSIFSIFEILELFGILDFLSIIGIPSIFTKFSFLTSNSVLLIKDLPNLRAELVHCHFGVLSTLHAIQYRHLQKILYGINSMY